MKKIVFSILAALMLSSCQNLLFDWQVGDANSEVTKTFQSAQKTQIKITFDDQSYCIQAHGIELKVIGNGIIIHTQIISSLPTTKQISVPVNSSIEVVTKAVPLNNDNSCKTLGNVFCRLYY